MCWGRDLRLHLGESAHSYIHTYFNSSWLQLHTIKTTLVIMPTNWTLSTLVVLRLLITTTSGATSIEKSDIITTHWFQCIFIMMTLSNGNIFRVAGHLCREFTSHWWIPHTKTSDAELWINGWVNNGEYGDLRRYRTHYDVTVTIAGNSSYSLVTDACIPSLTIFFSPRIN